MLESHLENIFDYAKYTTQENRYRTIQGIVDDVVKSQLYFIVESLKHLENHKEE